MLEVLCTSHRGGACMRRAGGGALVLLALENGSSFALGQAQQHVNHVSTDHVQQHRQLQSTNSNSTSTSTGSSGGVKSLRQVNYNAVESGDNDGGSSSSDNKKEIWINYDEPRGGAKCYRAMPNDKLKFFWDEAHNLKELTDRGKYDSCDFSGSTHHQAKGASNSGKFINL